MSPRFEHGLLAVVSVLLVAPASRAEDAKPPRLSADRAARIEQLEALLNAQQRRLDQLQQQLAADGGQDADTARVAAMREQIREILSEPEFRESLMPSIVTSGYDRGFYIRSTDERFKMQFNGVLQFRWTHAAIGGRNRYRLPRFERDDRTGFDVQRLRLIVRGHAYTPDLTYYVQVSSDVSNNYDFVVRDAYVNYRFADPLQFQAGIFKVAGTQSELISDSVLQFPDRPMISEIFSPARSLGARFWGQLFEKRLEYFLDVVNAFNSSANRTITPDPAELDNNPGIAFRVLWHALGEKAGKELNNEPDHDHLQSPALDFAFHYLFNDDDGDRRTSRIPFPSTRRAGSARGGFGLTTSNGLQINQFGWAYAFKYMGFSTRGEYFLRLLDPTQVASRPFTPWYLLTGQENTTAQQGAYVQAGYFLPIPGLEKKLEAVARVGGVSTLAGEREGAWEYTGGLNYYIEGDSVKVQMDVTKITEAPISSSNVGIPNVNDSPLIFRVQLQVAF